MDHQKYLVLAAFLEQVANVDGVTEQERAILNSFTQGVESEFAAAKASFDVAQLQSFAHEAIRTAFVVAMCDNNLTTAEVSFIQSAAKILALTDDEVKELRELATDDILSQMLHLPAEDIAQYRTRFLTVQ